MIRAAVAGDAAAIAAIYAAYVADTPISFELHPPDALEMLARMNASDGLYPWLVAVDPNDLVQAYAYASAFKTRAGYRFSVETSVYVRQGAHGEGVGGAIYTALLEFLRQQGFATAIASITLPNAASLALHRRLGFREVGVHRRIGSKHGEWHDAAQWQLQFPPLPVPPPEPRRFADLQRR